jgi:hypothetical protein
MIKIERIWQIELKKRTPLIFELNDTFISDSFFFLDI